MFSAWATMSTSWISPGSIESGLTLVFTWRGFSARAEFNAACEAWKAEGGKELETEAIYGDKGPVRWSRELIFSAKFGHVSGNDGEDGEQ
jgi:hypothetical protein